MINVLHIVDKLSVEDSSIHGVTRLLSWWIPRFDKNKFKMSVCTLRKNDKAAKYLEDLGIIVNHVSKNKYNPMVLYELYVLIRNNRINILHLHGYGAWTFGRILSSMINVPCVLHEHMVDSKINKIQMKLDWILARYTSLAIAVSNDVKEFISIKRCIPDNLIKVIYNGIPLAPFIPKSTEENFEIKNKYNVNPKHLVVSIVGRLSYIKGHIFFIEAAKKVIRNYKEIVFFIVGDGELQKDLEKYTQKRNIEKFVKFIGHVDKVEEVYKMTDILVIASIKEGGPITLFEGMASKCAIISTSTIGLKNIIENNDAGVLVPEKDAQAIADGILSLIKHEDKRKKITEAAFEVSKQYHVENTVKSIEKCYFQICK